MFNLQLQDSAKLCSGFTEWLTLEGTTGGHLLSQSFNLEVYQVGQAQFPLGEGMLTTPYYLVLYMPGDGFQD